MWPPKMFKVTKIAPKIHPIFSDTTGKAFDGYIPFFSSSFSFTLQQRPSDNLVCSIPFGAIPFPAFWPMDEEH